MHRFNTESMSQAGSGRLRTTGLAFYLSDHVPVCNWCSNLATNVLVTELRYGLGHKTWILSIFLPCLWSLSIFMNLFNLNSFYKLRYSWILLFGYINYPWILSIGNFIRVLTFYPVSFQSLTLTCFYIVHNLECILAHTRYIYIAYFCIQWVLQTLS